VTAKPGPFIHPITRLSICGLLAAGADWVEFAALRDAAGISDSVLSRNSPACSKTPGTWSPQGRGRRRPRTWFRLTAKAARRWRVKPAWLAQLEEAVSASTRDVTRPGPPW